MHRLHFFMEQINAKRHQRPDHNRKRIAVADAKTKPPAAFFDSIASAGVPNLTQNARQRKYRQHCHSGKRHIKNNPQCLFVVNPFHRCNKHNRSNRLIPIRAKITQPRNDSCRQHSKPFFFGILRHTELAGKQQKADPEHLSFQRIDPRTLVQDDNQKLQKKPCIKADPAELFYFSIFRMCNLLCHAVPFLWTTLSDRSFWIPALSDRQTAVRSKTSDTAHSSPPICGTQRV